MKIIKSLILNIFILVLSILVVPAIIAMTGGMPVQLDKTNSDTVDTSSPIKLLMTQSSEIVEMPTEEYLKGVVAAEMPALFEVEALKAQAVAARTYLVNKQGANLPEHNGADICDDSTHCKAYLSLDRLNEIHGKEWEKQYWGKISSAVDDTRGVLILYDNQPISAVFHSTAGGRTQNAEDIWGNSVPYLTSVVSEGDSASPKYETQATFSEAEFKEKMKAANNKVDFTSELFSNMQVGEGGAVVSITIGGQNFNGTQVRNIFGLNSPVFKIDNQNGTITFNVKGYGHGVGMSQFGANHLAKNGYNYEQILKFYYKGVEITNTPSRIKT